MANVEPKVSIVAGEMRLWTDLDNDRRPAAGGIALLALLEYVLGQAPAGRTLVVGPHAEEVLAQVGEATVVVRSLSDAEGIAERHPALHVICGDLVEVGGSYDLVIALDGVERVASNDRPTPAWTERLSHLAGLVADGGRLLLTVDNDASLLALADARPLAERRDTGDWESPVSTDLSRPAGQGSASSVLASLGFAGPAYAACWQPTAPGVLVDVTVPADDVRIRSALSAGTDALASYPLLFDVVTPAHVALRAAELASAASGWVFVAGRDAADLELPAAILDTGASEATVLASDDLLAPVGRASITEAAVERAQREDLGGLRTLMREYLPWAAKESRVPRPDDVVITEGGFAVLPGALIEEADPVAAAALWLARRLLAPDMRRIWPPWLDEADVARSLAAMAGVTLDAELLEATAVLLPSQLELVTEDVRTLRALNAQLLQELGAARGEVFAHERLASTRDRQLERRSVNLVKAEMRADAAERRVRELEEELRKINMAVTRRAGRAIKDPKAAARKVRRKLKKD